MTDRVKHNHYFKNVEHLKEIDVYRVLELFEVTNPCLAHALKKLLVAGGRGAGKDQNQDICEAIDSCQRFLQMGREDERGEHPRMVCIICKGTGWDPAGATCECRDLRPGQVTYVERNDEQ